DTEVVPSGLYLHRQLVIRRFWFPFWFVQVHENKIPASVGHEAVGGEGRGAQRVIEGTEVGTAKVKEQILVFAGRLRLGGVEILVPNEWTRLFLQVTQHRLELRT